MLKRFVVWLVKINHNMILILWQTALMVAVDSSIRRSSWFDPEKAMSVRKKIFARELNDCLSIDEFASETFIVGVP